MAIGGLSSGTGGASSIRGVGGLASGLDRDELIQNMTAGTRGKIAAQKQAKERLGWQQETLRGITSKLHEFSSKYMSYASESNLAGGKLFSRNLITALGENSKYIGVSGSPNSASAISILGVKQLAQNAQLNTKQDASTQTMQTGDVKYNLDEKTDVNLISGERLYISYGSKNYTVTLKDMTGHDYDQQGSAAAAINQALKEVPIGENKTLADAMKVELEADGKTMKFTSTDAANNEIKIAGGSGDILKSLGFLKDGETLNDLADDRTVISKTGLAAQEEAKLTEERSIAEQLGGKAISFVYNGKVQWIQLQSAEELAGKTLDDVKADLQTKLEGAFGKGRIKVNLTGSGDKRSFSFETTIPTKDSTGEIIPGGKDSSSTFSMSAADKGLLGNAGLFKVEAGVSNRVNLSSSITKSGLKDAAGVDKNVAPVLTINGVDIEGLSWDSSLSEIINKINANKEAGVNISYQANMDRFVVASTQGGASGQVKMEGSLANLILGTTSTAPADAYTEKQGQDAIIAVKYDGSSEAVEITRESNTFEVDGLNLTVKNKFGYNNGVLDPASEAVTLDAKVDSEKTTKTVKEMVDAYNEVLKLINDEVAQKPNRNYQPLTDEQREGMTDSQIEKWEKEAKKGMMFNDPDVRGLADALRFILPTNDRAALSKMGISVSSNYTDHGKLVFDETKFKAALDTDPNAVKELFTKAAETGPNGEKIDGGIMVKMKSVVDKYASMTGSTKGILVERGGSIYAPTSILKNSLQKQMDGVDDLLDKLARQLTTEQDRYIAQFSKLETMISQMNSQSSWLSQQG